MRTNNVIRNIKSTAILYSIKLVLQFLVRIVFVNTLSVEYLGINGLFSNILAVLSLTELGVGSAMVFNLYKPLAVSDSETVKSIMRLFKKAYICIGIVILTLGCVLVPWLDFFIKEKPDIPHIEWIYLLFVIDSSVSYFYSYKRSLLIADQKQSIANFYQGICQIVLGVLQSFFLVITKSYWAFIILKVFSTIIENYMVARKVDFIYPFLQDKQVALLETSIKKTILRNVKALFISKLGGIVIFSTTNIIISKLVGLAAVGIYSNYWLIINAVHGILSKMFEALTSSIGNLAVLETEEKKTQIFKTLEFITAWTACYITIGLFVLLNPLVKIWLGEQFLLSDEIVSILVLNFYLTYMRKPVQIYEDALGLFWAKRYMPIPEIIINLTIGILATQYLGLLGALLGMTISTLLVPFWFEPYIILKNGISYTFKEYYLRYGLYTIATIAIALFTKYCYSLILSNRSGYDFILGIFLCTFLPNFIWLLLFYKTKEFNYVKIIIKKLMGKFCF
ncbi:hypothetical protein [uncultured Phascolarctobacterium sp.]|uniref:lipopolysaccharide biosynthesis protein n=1 Tax=uncultured Phascolarctobacterium sp. TaxID=512296 RepID=UPI0025FDC454|nr:hypothetical protein [uncultured Phascolarctobacterium sp.]